MNLLGDKTVLAKVAPDHRPGVILVDVDVWFLLWTMELWGAMLHFDIIFHHFLVI